MTKTIPEMVDNAIEFVLIHKQWEMQEKASAKCKSIKVFDKASFMLAALMTRGPLITAMQKLKDAKQETEIAKNINQWAMDGIVHSLKVGNC